MDIMLDVTVAVVFFAIGAAVGVHNTPTVNKAIAAVKAAEADAVATLKTITDHKAS